MVVRELIALLGVKTDQAGIKKAEGSFKGLFGSIARMAGGFAALYLGPRALAGIVTAASDANETLNVLGAAFQDNQQDVLNWAKAFSDSAGRSEFGLREMAGTFGSVLNPLMENNAEIAADMSKRFSELTVDLGSFYNAQEPDVLLALRSGLTGEAEPLKRFGVVMNEATLKAYAMNQGIKGSIKDMSNAEKTALRYNFILDQTSLAHGDAAKTSKGFANAAKALRARLGDIVTRMGLRLIPVVESAIQLFLGWGDGIETFVDFLGGFLKTISRVVFWVIKFVSNLPTGAKIGLIAIAILKWGKALKWLLTPMGKVFILVALLIVIIDDLITWVEGGDSVFGRFFETLADLTGLPIDEWVKNIVKWFMRLAEDPVAAFEELVGGIMEFGHWFSVWIDDIKSSPGIVGAAVTVILGWFQAIGEIVAALVVFLINVWSDPLGAAKQFGQNLFDTVVTYYDKLGNLLGTLFDALLESLDPTYNRVVSWFSELGGEIKKWALGVIDWITSPFKEAKKLLDKLTGKETPEGSTSKGRFGGGAGGGFDMGIQGLQGIRNLAANSKIGPSSVSSSGGHGGSPIVNNQKTDVSVTVQAGPGMDEKKLGEVVTKTIGKEIEKQNRAAMSALVTKPAAI